MVAVVVVKSDNTVLRTSVTLASGSVTLGLVVREKTLAGKEA